MAKMDIRFSIVDLINIGLLLTLYCLLALSIGWEPIIIAAFIMLMSGSIYVLTWILIIISINKRDNLKRPNVTTDSSNDQSVNGFKDFSFQFLVLLFVLFIVIVPSFSFIVFGFGSVFIAGITITIFFILSAVIKFKIPWPSRMTRRNLGFEIEDKASS